MGNARFHNGASPVYVIDMYVYIIQEKTHNYVTMTYNNEKNVLIPKYLFTFFIFFFFYPKFCIVTN